MHFNSRPGQSIAKYAIALANNDASPNRAALTLEKQFGADSEEAHVARAFAQKAAVLPAQVTEANWGGSIAAQQFGEFVVAVTEQSILGRLNPLPAPANSTVASLTTAIGADWRQEAKPIPLRRGTMSSAALDPLGIASLVAVSKALIKTGNDDAVEIVRRRLIAAAIETIDAAFIDPTNGGTANVKPASVLNAPTAVPTTGDANDDLQALIADFGGDLDRASFVAHPKTYASMNGSLYPDVGLRSGSLLNAPAIASRSCPAGVIALLDADGICLAMSAPSVDTSDKPTVIMADDAADPGQAVSMWQAGVTAIRLIQNANWAAIRAGSASYISGAAY